MDGANQTDRQALILDVESSFSDAEEEFEQNDLMFFHGQVWAVSPYYHQLSS